MLEGWGRPTGTGKISVIENVFTALRNRPHRKLLSEGPANCRADCARLCKSRSDRVYNHALDPTRAAA